MDELVVRLWSRKTVAGLTVVRSEEVDELEIGTEPRRVGYADRAAGGGGRSACHARHVLHRLRPVPRPP